MTQSAATHFTVHGRATSSNVQALLWGMEEMGLAYHRVDRGGDHGGLDEPHFLAMNPQGLIPVLEVDGRALFETAAILRYLAGEHAAPHLWPEDPLARAEVDMWAEWAKHEVAARFTGPVFWRVARTPPKRREPDLIRAALDRLNAELAIAEERLKRTPFLIGEALTLADIQFGHILYRYFDIELDRRPFTAIHDYYTRLTERSAYQRTVMVSYVSLTLPGSLPRMTDTP
ncbi:MAG: glutathione S-transferase family protein [Pseudomonadota bacterium]